MSERGSVVLSSSSAVVRSSTIVCCWLASFSLLLRLWEKEFIIDCDHCLNCVFHNRSWIHNLYIWWYADCWCIAISIESLTKPLWENTLSLASRRAKWSACLTQATNLTHFFYLQFCPQRLHIQTNPLQHTLQRVLYYFMVLWCSIPSNLKHYLGLMLQLFEWEVQIGHLLRSPLLYHPLKSPDLKNIKLKLRFTGPDLLKKKKWRLEESFIS